MKKYDKVICIESFSSSPEHSSLGLTDKNPPLEGEIFTVLDTRMGLVVKETLLRLGEKSDPHPPIKNWYRHSRFRKLEDYRKEQEEERMAVLKEVDAGVYINQ